jgi:hypothetical protein
VRIGRERGLQNRHLRLSASTARAGPIT